MKVLVTGATGFLGYHIVTACLEAGHELLCMKRRTSLSPFPESLSTQLRWFEIGTTQAVDTVQSFQPEVLIHAAWGGVDATGRNDEATQQRNVELTEHVYKLYPYRQMITIGSQDEYGNIHECVREDHPLNPTSQYARAKITCQAMQERYAAAYGAEWQWVRLFGTYGSQQQDCWVIPSVVRQCLEPVPVIETTPGEQRYSFLEGRDFARAIISMIGITGHSGIYNLSSDQPIALIELFELIKEITGSTSVFSRSLPYRENQSMVILGDSRRFIDAFGSFERIRLRDGLQELTSALKL